MTLTHIANLLDPLQSAIVLQSWEDAEDIAKEIARLSRLKRLSELQKIQEALQASGSHQGAESKSTLENYPLMAPGGSQGAKRPLQVNLSDRFSIHHDEDWRNQVAGELNTILITAGNEGGPAFQSAARSIAARVAHFEEIMVERP